MRVLVLGANGRTGRLVVDSAIELGHAVTVLVRNGARFHRSGVRVIEGDGLNGQDVLRAMQGQDAVVECIGGVAPWKYQTLEREVMRHIVSAMDKTGARRLVVVSAMGVADSARQVPWWYRWLLMPTFLRGIIADKQVMESIVRESELDWVIARAPVLSDGPAIGSVHVLEQGETGRAVTRADLALWLVQQLQGKTYVGQAVVMVN